jgi:hypothetical protein
MDYRGVFVAMSVVVGALSGCSHFEKSRDDTAALMNPTKIHTAYSTDSDAYKASKIPVDDYYHALQVARTTYATDASGNVTKVTKADHEAVENYVDEGIGLVDAYCLRWFQRLDDMNRLLDYQNKNVNVITQLGTALLGIGKASSNVISGYGAANTAYAGASENFNSAFLVAPTAARVKDHIQSVMRDEATALRSDAATLDFKQAYTRLEQYADLCTHTRAKAIVDTALDLTKTNLNEETKQPETVTK